MIGVRNVRKGFSELQCGKGMFSRHKAADVGYLTKDSGSQRLPHLQLQSLVEEV